MQMAEFFAVLAFSARSCSPCQRLRTLFAWSSCLQAIQAAVPFRVLLVSFRNTVHNVFSGCMNPLIIFLIFRMTVFGMNPPEKKRKLHFNKVTSTQPS